MEEIFDTCMNGMSVILIVLLISIFSPLVIFCYIIGKIALKCGIDLSPNRR